MPVERTPCTLPPGSEDAAFDMQVGTSISSFEREPMRFTPLFASILLAATATPALAQDATDPPPAFKLTGGTTLITDYRFRGVTQTGGEPALQTTINLNSRTGFYVGTWMSMIDGSGGTPALRGYGDAEVDLYGGFTRTFGGVGVDAGLLYYYYPGGLKGQNTDFLEPYASATYTIGPVAAKVGAAYAWDGERGLTGFDARSDDDSNLYLYGEASLGIPTTPVTLKGHFGHSKGSLGSLNPAGSRDDTYSDWSVTAEAVGGPLKVGVSYVDTDITNARVAGFTRNGFARQLGRGSTVLGYIGTSF